MGTHDAPAQTHQGQGQGPLAFLFLEILIVCKQAGEPFVCYRVGRVTGDRVMDGPERENLLDCRMRLLPAPQRPVGQTHPTLPKCRFSPSLRTHPPPGPPETQREQPSDFLFLPTMYPGGPGLENVSVLLEGGRGSPVREGEERSCLRDGPLHLLSCVGVVLPQRVAGVGGAAFRSSPPVPGRAGTPGSLLDGL